MRATRGFLARPATEVAPLLLGWTISHTTDEGTVAVTLTEVEAYMGEHDPASHAYRGATERAATMFGAAGHLYCYLSHGLHVCCNVVTGTPGTASAVLLRAGRVVEGVELARARRGPSTADRSLARGPGCLGEALGIDLAQRGADLLDGGALSLARGTPGGAVVECGPRVGVSRAQEVAWRFWLAGEPSVSAYRRAPQARVASRASRPRSDPRCV